MPARPADPGLRPRRAAFSSIVGDRLRPSPCGGQPRARTAHGVKLLRATLDREARRQGQRAQALRRQFDAQATAQPTVAKAPQLELPLEPYQMIIQMDAWNICERDAWGQSAALRRQGQEPERWH